MRRRFLENGHDGLEVADGAPDEVLHVESTSWGSIDLIRPLVTSILLLFYAKAKPDSLALDKEPVEEEDQVEEEEDKVMLEKFHFEEAPI